VAADDLQPLRIASALTTRRLGRSFELREITDSTNDDARAAANAGAPDGHLVLADAQRSGRGSRGRSWDSPAGSDLYLSFVVRSELPLSRLAPLTLAVGLGVAQAADAFLPAGKCAAIKWPNDVWLGRAKLAGVLVEGASIGTSSLPLIVGIGLNVNRLAFPEPLDTPPTSLRRERGEPADRVQVLVELLARVELWLDSFLDGQLEQVVHALDARLCLRGERARCDELEGVVLGVAASGALRFSVAGVERELVAGTLRPLAGA
jgi:BirA family transcriptional regulator, biotin operon repressor / biotin---[acetyl-CoA-carboxylase] ligase